MQITSEKLREIIIEEMILMENFLKLHGASMIYLIRLLIRHLFLVLCGFINLRWCLLSSLVETLCCLWLERLPKITIMLLRTEWKQILW